jgi:hypothetical protein
LFEPLRKAWVANELSPLQVRLIYGLTTITVIFTLGALVGALMWLIAKVASRRTPEARE